MAASQGYFCSIAYDKCHVLLTKNILIWGLFYHFSLWSKFGVIWNLLISSRILIVLNNLSFDRIPKFWTNFWKPVQIRNNKSKFWREVVQMGYPMKTINDGKGVGLERFELFFVPQIYVIWMTDPFEIQWRYDGGKIAKIFEWIKWKIQI